MKICLYTNHLGRASQNGTAITIMSIDIANALKDLGHEVLLPYVIRLSNILKAEKPDIIMSFMKAQTTILSIAKMINPSTNTIYREHTKQRRLLRLWGKCIHTRYLIKFLYERLDYLAAPSYAIKKDLQQTFFIREDKFKIIPNCTNFEKLDVLAKEQCDLKADFINIGTG